MQNNKANKFTQAVKSRGYYIALFLCLIAVGTTGYVYYRSSDTPTPTTAPTESVQPSKPQINRPSGASKDVVKDAISKQTVPAPTEAQTLQVSAPLDGETLRSYAMDHLSYNETTKDWRTHAGMDIAADAGSEVHAAAKGVVSAIFDDDLLGKTVVVSHPDESRTYYCNLAEEVPVHVGDQVSSQTVLGTVGTTAIVEVGAEPHLHFAVYRNAQCIDPEDFLSAE